ncbi:MAG: hypothetical protein M3R58_04875 [Pseudomonadota bacterium]|nr:hypothetical protein [Pseudomonadota bacterium]
MASETRRAAKALIERRVERFESRHAADESKSRLDRALANVRPEGRVVFTARWDATGPRCVLNAEFAPAPGIQRLLKVTSAAMTALLVASAWIIFTPRPEGDAAAFLLPLFTGLAILALPFAFVALGSNREAEEARIRKAIRAALVDGD